MRNVFLAVSISTVLGTVVFAQTASEVYSSKDGNFRVKFERAPKIKLWIRRGPAVCVNAVAENVGIIPTAQNVHVSLRASATP